MSVPWRTCGVHAPPNDRPYDVHQPRQLPLQHSKLPHIPACTAQRSGSSSLAQHSGSSTSSGE